MHREVRQLLTESDNLGVKQKKAYNHMPIAHLQSVNSSEIHFKASISMLGESIFRSFQFILASSGSIFGPFSMQQNIFSASHCCDDCINGILKLPIRNKRH